MNKKYFIIAFVCLIGGLLFIGMFRRYVQENQETVENTILVSKDGWKDTEKWAFHNSTVEVWTPVKAGVQPFSVKVDNQIFRAKFNQYGVWEAIFQTPFVTDRSKIYVKLDDDATAIGAVQTKVTLE